MGYCCLPPERVELTVNSKKKQLAGSKWAEGQDGLMQERNKWQDQNGPRVKIGCCGGDRLLKQ